MEIDKVDREELKNLLIEALSHSPTFKHIQGINPCHISFDGVEYFIYIKNLTPAQLSNNNLNIWRIQLPVRDIFTNIKKSELPFILLGYDTKNDVYTTWNPYWSKQRLNLAQSVSFYSRLSLQNKANDTQEFHSQLLNNESMVFAFPRNKISFFLKNIDTFYPDLSDYVALGSKRRSKANKIFHSFNDIDNLDGFENYLSICNLKDRTIYNYKNAISSLINDGYFSNYKKIFLAYDLIKDYHLGATIFFKTPEIYLININSHYTFSAALSFYIKFLENKESIQENYDNFPLDSDDEPNSNINIVIEEEEKEIVLKDKEDEIDWESQFIDHNGKLKNIANPVLIDLLRPVLDVEYKSLASAYNIVGDFYGDRFSSMELKDWQRLFNIIDWSNPYYNVETVNDSLKGKKTHILRVTYPDGKVIQERKVTNTFVYVIENAYPDLIRDMDIKLAGVNLICDSVSNEYGKYQKSISNGFYVMTLCSTDKKQHILQKISDELELDLLIEQISLSEIEKATNPIEGQTRSKIRVTFPDGRIVQENKVFKTLIEVVLFVGVENVRQLNLIINGDNLITNTVNPLYETAMKPLDKGFYINTYCSTQKKYEIIQSISKIYLLNLKVELV